MALIVDIPAKNRPSSSVSYIAGKLRFEMIQLPEPAECSRDQRLTVKGIAMYKLVILIEPLEDQETFDDNWPEFLHHAERMPGLLSETSGHVDPFLYGSQEYARMHELYFNSREDAQSALTSAHGRAAGALLQRITWGRVCLFLADHRQDDIENISRYTRQNDQTEES